VDLGLFVGFSLTLQSGLLQLPDGPAYWKFQLNLDHFGAELPLFAQ
jgi:hypothetical protein